MAFKMTDIDLMFGAYDVSCDSNSAALTVTVAELDTSTLCSDWAAAIPGAQSWEVTQSGFYTAGTGEIDPHAWNQVGSNDVPLIVAPLPATAASAAYFGVASETSLTKGGQYGEVFELSFAARGDGPLVRGELALPQSARTTTATSTASQLGAVTAAQKVWCALAVTAASGTSPTLDVVLASDNDSGMGTATDQVTMTQATGATSEILSTAGAITDDWWQVTATIGGTTPSFTFTVAIGIAAD